MVKEEEIMGLYALARDEIEGVTVVCEKLEKTTNRLELLERNVETYVKTGVRASLDDRKNLSAADSLSSAMYFQMSKRSSSAAPVILKRGKINLVSLLVFGLLLFQ